MFHTSVPYDLAPLEACRTSDGRCVLAVVIRVEGPSYRPVGAMMAFFAQAEAVGSLSSGCIEADLELHARDCLASGSPKVVVYGRGSPYLDIALPCGGGLHILLVPDPDRAAIGDLLHAVITTRKATTLEIDPVTGGMTQEPTQNADAFRITLLPELKLIVFGKGPEASAFTALAQSTGFETVLVSPDPATLQVAKGLACTTISITKPSFPSTLQVDERSAIVLFFHDHDWEPAILQAALATKAFYIGAQGSMRARDNRAAVLQERGVTQSDLERIKGPIGLINSARDARTLAISVLAEIVAIGA